MTLFKVQLRAIRHLTRELTIEAEDKEQAYVRALRRANTDKVDWDESEPEDVQVESIEPEPAPKPEPVFVQLPSAMSNRSQHYANLNYYQTQDWPAHTMLGKFWQIDEDIYEEFLNMLPPQYCAGGFRLIEKLTGSIAATFLRIGAHHWCGYTDRETVEPHRLLNHILKDCHK